MRIKKDYVLRTIADENIVIPRNDAMVTTNALLVLNEQATFLWNILSTGANISVYDLVDEMCNIYDVSRDTAENDINEFLSILNKHSMLDYYEE